MRSRSVPNTKNNPLFSLGVFLIEKKLTSSMCAHSAIVFSRLFCKNLLNFKVPFDKQMLFLFLFIYTYRKEMARLAHMCLLKVIYSFSLPFAPIGHLWSTNVIHVKTSRTANSVLSRLKPLHRTKYVISFYIKYVVKCMYVCCTTNMLSTWTTKKLTFLTQ